MLFLKTVEGWILWNNWNLFTAHCMFIINGNDDWDPRDQHISETMHCPTSWSPSHLASLKYSRIHLQVFSLPSNPLSKSKISALKMLRRKENEAHEEFWDFDPTLAKGQFWLWVWKPESPHESVTNTLSVAEWVFTCWAAIGGKWQGIQPSMVSRTLSHLVGKENIHTGKDLTWGHASWTGSSCLRLVRVCESPCTLKTVWGKVAKTLCPILFPHSTAFSFVGYTEPFLIPSPPHGL